MHTRGLSLNDHNHGFLHVGSDYKQIPLQISSPCCCVGNSNLGPLPRSKAREDDKQGYDIKNHQLRQAQDDESLQLRSDTWPAKYDLQPL